MMRRNRVPTSEQYADAFREILKPGAPRRRMLLIHYAAPHKTVTATELAEQMGYPGYSAANLQYGILGGKVGVYLAFRPTDEGLGSLVTFKKRSGEWHWILRPQVAAALEQLGWVEKAK